MLGATDRRSGGLGAPASLGTRRIRSAGRGTGSVEITLPVKLDVLTGVQCRVVLRDGPRPEIVLRPDVSSAQALVHDLWGKLREGLRGVGDIGEFSPWDFTLTLFPSSARQRRPLLAYADSFALLRETNDPGRHGPELARLLAHLAVAAAERLGLRGAWALGFGESVAYVMTGVSADLGTDLERAMAHRAFWGDGAAPRETPPHDEMWGRSTAGLQRIYERFDAWQADPEVHARERRRWRGALALEGPAGGPWDDGSGREVMA